VATIWEPVGVGRDGAPVERSQTIIVNARRFGDQTLPTVTVLDDDDFVVAWVGEDGAVWTRRFHRDGTHATGRLERPANQTITGKQHEPAAAATRGNVMVAYTSAMFAGGDTEILGRVLDPDGAEVRREERLHGADTRDQRRPAVAGSEAGFVVVWDNMVGNATKGISGHRFDTTGAPLGGLISIEESPAEVGELHPAVAALPDGSFVVVHGGRKSNNGARAVATRAFDKDGAPLSSVSAFEPVGRRPDAAVAAHPTRDSYAAAWLHESSGIRLAILSRDGGVASGPVFAISSDAADPSVAVSADDRIALCWNTPYTDSRLYCRIFAYDGFHPFGSDITVFPNMPSGQARAKVAWLRTGGFLVAGDTNRVDLDGHAVLVRPFDSLGFAGNPIRLANRAQPGNQLTAFIIPVSTSRVWVGWQGPEPDGEDVGVRFRILERL